MSNFVNQLYVIYFKIHNDQAIIYEYFLFLKSNIACPKSNTSNKPPIKLKSWTNRTNVRNMYPNVRKWKDHILSDSKMYPNIRKKKNWASHILNLPQANGTSQNMTWLKILEFTPLILVSYIYVLDFAH